MNKYIRITIVTLIALGLSAGKAHADDEALAALGGFIAGIITGAVIEDHHDYDRHSDVRIRVGSDHRYGDRDRCVKHGHRGCNACFKANHRGRGHYEVRYVRVWVPGRWEFVRNRCGDRVRVWKSGYYSTRPEKVWVSRSGKGHRGSYCG